MTTKSVGHVTFDYDQKLNIVFIEPHWEVHTREDVDAFFAEYVRFFGALSKPAYMVVNIDHLRVHADIAGYYGELARSKVIQHLLGYARYGDDALARMLIRTSSSRAGIAANIHDSREQALAAVEVMKQNQRGKV